MAVAGKMIAIAAIFSFLCTSAVALRIYARRLRKARLGVDDYTIIAALIFTLGYAVIMFIGGSTKGGVGKHSPIDPTTTLPVLNYQLKNLLQSSFSSLLVGTFSVGLTKISVVMLYRRIFRSSGNSRWFSIATWSLIAITILWMTAFFFGNLFECHPIKANWEEYGGTAEQCIFEDPMYEGQAWVDTLTDLFILLVPIPCVWGLNMPLKQKLAVTFMFLLGGVTLAISIVKLVYWYQAFALLEAFDVDLGWIITPTIYWVMIESSVAICGACMPLFKPIFDDCVPVVRLTSYIRDLSSPSTRGSTRRGLFDDDVEKNGGEQGVSKSSVISHESVQVDPAKSLVTKPSFN